MYKLYKLTVEYQFVVVAKSAGEAERTASEIMTTHAGELLSPENMTQALAESISDVGELPEGWLTSSLPYSKYSSYNIPEELEDKTVEEILNGNV